MGNRYVRLAIQVLGDPKISIRPSCWNPFVSHHAGVLRLRVPRAIEKFEEFTAMFDLARHILELLVEIGAVEAGPSSNRARSDRLVCGPTKGDGE
jgi:hypothetical protein